MADEPWPSANAYQRSPAAPSRLSAVERDARDEKGCREPHARAGVVEGGADKRALGAESHYGWINFRGAGQSAARKLLILRTERCPSGTRLPDHCQIPPIWRFEQPSDSRNLDLHILNLVFVFTKMKCHSNLGEIPEKGPECCCIVRLGWLPLLGYHCD